MSKQKSLNVHSQPTPGVRGWERIIEIDRFIRAHQYPNPERMAEKLEVSERSIYSDIRHMRKHLGHSAKLISPTAAGLIVILTAFRIPPFSF